MAQQGRGRARARGRYNKRWRWRDAREPEAGGDVARHGLWLPNHKRGIAPQVGPQTRLEDVICLRPNPLHSPPRECAEKLSRPDGSGPNSLPILCNPPR